MGNLDTWDIALLVIAGYVALVTLVRMMIRRRDLMMNEFREKVAEERQAREKEKKKEQRAAKRQSAA